MTWVLYLFPLILCGLILAGMVVMWVAVEVDEYRWRRRVRRVLDRHAAERGDR